MKYTCYLESMERTKKTIDITKPAVIRLPKDYTDRLLAEGIKDVVMNVDDEKRILVIRPVENK